MSSEQTNTTIVTSCTPAPIDVASPAEITQEAVPDLATPKRSSEELGEPPFAPKRKRHPNMHAVLNRNKENYLRSLRKRKEYPHYRDNEIATLWVLTELNQHLADLSDQKSEIARRMSTENRIKLRDAVRSALWLVREDQCQVVYDHCLDNQEAIDRMLYACASQSESNFERVLKGEDVEYTLSITVSVDKSEEAEKKEVQAMCIDWTVLTADYTITGCADRKESIIFLNP